MACEPKIDKNRVNLTCKVNTDKSVEFCSDGVLIPGEVKKEGDALKLYFRNTMAGFANGVFPAGYKFIYSIFRAKILASKSDKGWQIGFESHDEDTKNFLDIMFDCSYSFQPSTK